MVSNGITIPSEFEVRIHPKQESQRARLIWRDETQAGFRFISSFHANVVPIETAARIAALQKERDKLARRVAQLSEPA